MSDYEQYTPTTEEVRAVVAEIWRINARIHPAEFDRWLAAHDAQMREEGAKAMREAAAVADQNAFLNHDITPAGPFTAQQRAADEARTQIAAAIRALPIPSTGAENTDNDEKED